MDFEIWNYPHVDTLCIAKNPDNTLSADETIPTPELSPEEQNRQAEHQAQMQAITNHLNLLSSINQALTRQLNEINETSLTNLTLLIKKVAETVIRKELAADLNHDRLTATIKQAIADVQQDNTPCTIYIATEHYNFFSSLDSMPSDVTFKADPTIKPGDFRIKTAFSELESILDKHLQELFGLQDE